MLEKFPSGERHGVGYCTAVRGWGPAAAAGLTHGTVYATGVRRRHKRQKLRIPACGRI
ncbi:MAG: hypothetical protein JSV33_09855 [bacterium]|nr:MAG: hypothetical protein JSV33_09855 [bacterium]